MPMNRVNKFGFQRQILVAQVVVGRLRIVADFLNTKTAFPLFCDMKNVNLL